MNSEMLFQVAFQFTPLATDRTLESWLFLALKLQMARQVLLVRIATETDGTNMPGLQSYQQDRDNNL